jgi:hypothetical protein
MGRLSFVAATQAGAKGACLHDAILETFVPLIWLIVTESRLTGIAYEQLITHDYVGYCRRLWRLANNPIIKWIPLI